MAGYPEGNRKTTYTQVAVVDLKTRKVLAHWPVAPGGSPVGLAIDPEKHRLFIGCRKPQKLLVMSTDDGKVVGDLPIAPGVDATRWNGHQAFASTREGKLSVAEEKGGQWQTVQTVTTGLGTKTMDIDKAAQKIYLPTAEFGEAGDASGGQARNVYDRRGGATLAYALVDMRLFDGRLHRK